MRVIGKEDVTMSNRGISKRGNGVNSEGKRGEEMRGNEGRDMSTKAVTIVSWSGVCLQCHGHQVSGAFVVMVTVC